MQNNSTLAGYNPNEEHALMLAGQAYALRDDLNDTSASSYSSAPSVLVEYTDSDSRLAMKAFKVLREKPESGIFLIISRRQARCCRRLCRCHFWQSR